MISSSVQAMVEFCMQKFVTGEGPQITDFGD